MTPLPKKKLSKSRTHKRLAAQKYTVPSVVVCPNCKGPTLPHAVCPNCGYYKGSEVIKPKEKVKVTKVTQESSKNSP